MSTVDDTRTRRRPAAGVVVAALVALVLLALPTLLGSTRGQQVLADLSLRHQPASFTELAFPNPSAIAGFVNQDGDTLFNFTVTNRADTTRTVRFRVVEQTGESATKRLASGTVRVAPGRTATREVATSVTCTTRSRVEVRTTSAGVDRQTIGFLVQGLKSSSGYRCYAGARR